MHPLPANPLEHASVPTRQPRCDSSSSESCLCLSYLQRTQHLGCSFGRPSSIWSGKSTALDVVSVLEPGPLRHRRFCTVASGLFLLAGHYRKRKKSSGLRRFCLYSIYVAPKHILPGRKTGLAFWTFLNTAILQTANLLKYRFRTKFIGWKAKSTITDELFITKGCRAVYTCSYATKTSLFLVNRCVVGIYWLQYKYQ